MKRRPRHRSARITDRGFLGMMSITGFLTADVAFAVYLHGLQRETVEMARSHAFGVLVFAELLRFLVPAPRLRPSGASFC